MLVYYFVPFIVSNRYLLFRDSNGHVCWSFAGGGGDKAVSQKKIGIILEVS